MLPLERGCSSVVERMLCMYEAPSSILGISIVTFSCRSSIFDHKRKACKNPTSPAFWLPAMLASSC